MSDWARRLTPKNGWHLRHQILRIGGYVFVIVIAGSWWFVSHAGEPWLRAAVPWVVPAFLVAIVVPFFVPIVLYLRGAELDAGLARLGIRGRTWTVGLREWHGAIAGRALDATYVRAARTLTLAIGASSRTMVAIRRGDVRVGWVELRGRAVVPPDDPPGVSVDASDPDWAGNLLADADALAAVRALLSGEIGREGRCIYVRPTVVELVRRSFDPRPATAEIPEHVAALGRLAGAIERQPPPKRALAENAYVRAYRRAPGFFGIAGTAVGIVGAIVWTWWSP